MSDRHLAAYLARLGLARAPPATPAGLAQLQAAQRRAIAFENLDIALGRAIHIDSERAFAKLVTRRRGGYCFEQNRLFADMLAALGLPTRPLLARVRLGLGLAEDAAPPRTHVLLLGDIEGERWIADAGFGGSYVPPMPLADGAEAATGDGARHRLRRIGTGGTLAGEFLLERAGPHGASDGRAAAHGEWQAQYSFDLAEVAADDLEQANHWTATRPGTRFTTLHVASIATEDGFAALTDRALSQSAGVETAKREIAAPGDYREVLREIFGLDLDAGEVAALPLFART